MALVLSYATLLSTDSMTTATHTSTAIECAERVRNGTCARNFIGHSPGHVHNNAMMRLLMYAVRVHQQVLSRQPDWLASRSNVILCASIVWGGIAVDCSIP